MNYLQRNKLIQTGIGLLAAAAGYLIYSCGYNNGFEDMNRVNINYLHKYVPDCLDELNKQAAEHPERVSDPDLWTPWSKM